MKTKDVPERNSEKNSEKYNYLKSIKEKEQKIIHYYRKVSNINKEKITIIPKQKKRTKKNIKIDEKDEPFLSVVEKEKEYEKKTKKQIVIMDD
jgi:hypothetical protein